MLMCFCTNVSKTNFLYVQYVCWVKCSWLSSFRRLLLQLRPICWGSRRSWREKLPSWTAENRRYRAEARQVIKDKTSTLLSAVLSEAAWLIETGKQYAMCALYTRERNITTYLHTGFRNYFEIYSISSTGIHGQDIKKKSTKNPLM